MDPALSMIRIGPADAGRYARLRRRMLEAAPWAFGARLDADVVLTRTADVLGDPRNAVVAVELREGEARPLVASAGLRRGQSPSFAHRVMLWGVFVEEAYRRRGLGRDMMRALFAIARGWDGVQFVDLAVTDRSPDALALYQSLGFAVTGRTTEAAPDGTGSRDELHMSLTLGDRG